MFYLELERPNELEIQVVGLPVLLSGAGKWCEKEKVAQMQLLIVELHEMVTVAQRQPVFLEMVMLALNREVVAEVQFVPVP